MQCGNEIFRQRRGIRWFLYDLLPPDGRRAWGRDKKIFLDRGWAEVGTTGRSQRSRVAPEYPEDKG
jgi:hypothetical protein